MARMTARYNGQCSVCGERIHAGETIEYDRAQGGARHPDCAPFVAPEGAIWISQGQGYGGQAYTVGAVIHDTQHGYIRVLHATQRYWREDGFSFGVGDESGYVYEACCVPATDEESAPLRAQEARYQERQAARNAVAAIGRRIRDKGEYPQPAEVNGASRVLFSTRNIYGGGAWFLLASGEVWYCEGNGGDGDNWSESNLGSAIAHRLADPDGALAAELERLAAALEPREGTVTDDDR